MPLCFEMSCWNSGRCVAFKDSVVEILPSNWKILVEFESGLLIVESVVQGLVPAIGGHLK